MSTSANKPSGLAPGAANADATPHTTSTVAGSAVVKRASHDLKNYGGPCKNPRSETCFVAFDSAAHRPIVVTPRKRESVEPRPNFAPASHLLAANSPPGFFCHSLLHSTALHAAPPAHRPGEAMPAAASSSHRPFYARSKVAALARPVSCAVRSTSHATFTRQARGRRAATGSFASLSHECHRQWALRRAACVVHASRHRASICPPAGPLPRRASSTRLGCRQASPQFRSPHITGARLRPSRWSVLAGGQSRRALAFLRGRARWPQATLRAPGKNETRAPPAFSVRGGPRTQWGASAARGAGAALAAGAPARLFVPAQQRAGQRQRQQQHHTHAHRAAHPHTRYGPRTARPFAGIASLPSPQNVLPRSGPIVRRGSRSLRAAARFSAALRNLDSTAWALDTRGITSPGVSTMKCTNCMHGGATPYVYRGVTSYLCADCRQELSLAIAATNRFRAVMWGLLCPKRQ